MNGMRWIISLFNLGLAVASTITATTPTNPIQTFRNPLDVDGATLKFVSINGTTTIWAASFTATVPLTSRFYFTGEGTVTDVGTSLTWRDTRSWNEFNGNTVILTDICNVNVTIFWCAGWGLEVINNATTTIANRSISGDALVQYLPTMTVTNGTLAALNTQTTRSFPTPTKSQLLRSIQDLDTNRFQRAPALSYLLWRNIV
jgi:hypothetical protein